MARYHRTYSLHGQEVNKPTVVLFYDRWVPQALITHLGTFPTITIAVGKDSKGKCFITLKVMQKHFGKVCVFKTRSHDIHWRRRHPPNSTWSDSTLFQTRPRSNQRPERCTRHVWNLGRGSVKDVDYSSITKKH